MVGSGLPYNDGQEVSTSPFKYQQSLDTLTGLNKKECELEAPLLLRSPLIIYVSATNALVTFKELYDKRSI